MTAWVLCTLAAVSCSKKETLRTTMIASIPDSGTLSTNFIIPDSSHVFLLVGWRGTAEGTVQGKITLVSENATNSIVMSMSNPDANWLRHLGLNSVLVNTQSLTDKMAVGNRHQPGSKCQILLALTNAPKSSAVYVGYLK